MTDDTIRVLHVDDEPDFADTAAMFLEREDERITVETATTAEEGLELLASDTDFGCIVSDYDMPGQNGIEFLERVRETYDDDLPFVMFTGKGSEEIASEAISAGVTDYLQKRSDPSQYTVLANRIANAVEHARTQRQVRQNERQLRELIDALPHLLYVVDEGGTYLLANEALAAFHDTAVDAIEGASVSEVLPRPLAEQIHADIEIVLDADEPRRLSPVEVPDAFGETHVFEPRMLPYDFGPAECRTVLGIAADITEREAYETRIESLHRTTRELMTAETEQEIAEITVTAIEQRLDFPLGVFRFLEDDDRLVPAAFSEGFDDEVDNERPVYRVGQPTAGLAFDRGETLVYEDLGELDDDLQHTPGGSLYVPVGEYGVITISDTVPDAFTRADVSVAEILAANAEAALDRVTQTQALHQRNEHLEEVIDLVAHDLRNPLEVAIGRLELVRETGDLTNLTAVERALDRIDELITDLLTLAQEGSRVTDRDAVGLATLVEDCWHVLPSDSATLVVETDRTVHADRQRLQRLLENLLENAVRHGGESVTITVGDCDEGFYIADDGPGIPEDERERVFESGYSTADTGGTGFGLSIVKQVVDAHGWGIRVTESATGGARFEITGLGSTTD